MSQKILTNQVIATGSALPRKALSNQDIVSLHGLDSSDEWIKERTGISQRYVAQDDENTATLAVEASRRALQKACLAAEEIDMIICATTTPVHTFPSVAVMVQKELGCNVIPAFDIQAVCAGFTYALSLTQSILSSSGHIKNILVIGAETMTRILDWQDRRTCILFGDGAGAFIISRRLGDVGSGILAVNTYANGQHLDKLYTSGGPSFSDQNLCGYIRMQGLEVFRFAVESMTQSMIDLLEQNQTPLSSVDWIIPHQANQRILDAVGRKMGVSSEKIVSTIAQHANTSAASIPLAVDTALQKNMIQPGQTVLFSSMGAGFTWGSALVRWS